MTLCVCVCVGGWVWVPSSLSLRGGNLVVLHTGPLLDIDIAHLLEPSSGSCCNQRDIEGWPIPRTLADRLKSRDPACVLSYQDLSLVNLFSWHFSSSKLWIYSHVTNWQITTQQCGCRVYVQQMLRPFRSFNFFIDGWWRAACWKTRGCVVVWKLGDLWCTCGFEAGIFLTQVSIWLFDTYIFQIPFHPIRLL